MHRDLRDLVRSVEQYFGGEHLERDAAEGIDVRRGGCRSEALREHTPDFGSAIRPRSTPLPDLPSGEAKVHEDALLSATENHVRRLEIEMAQADAVHGLEPRQHVVEN